MSDDILYQSLPDLPRNARRRASLSTIRDADRAIVINDGEIVEEGTHQQLLDQRGFYHHLYISRFKGQEI